MPRPTVKLRTAIIEQPNGTQCYLALDGDDLRIALRIDGKLCPVALVPIDALASLLVPCPECDEPRDSDGNAASSPDYQNRAAGEKGKL